MSELTRGATPKAFGVRSIAWLGQSEILRAVPSMKTHVGPSSIAHSFRNLVSVSDIRSETDRHLVTWPSFRDSLRTVVFLPSTIIEDVSVRVADTLVTRYSFLIGSHVVTLNVAAQKLGEESGDFISSHPSEIKNWPFGDHWVTAVPLLLNSFD